jgi:hypothetical protein
VQFRALVTPCMPTCEPVQCDEEDFGGELRSIVSYGRKRRSLNDTIVEARRKRRSTEASKNPHDDMLLVQSIQITDKFGFASKQQQAKPTVSSSETVFYATPDTQSFCVNGMGEFNRLGSAVCSEGKFIDFAKHKSRILPTVQIFRSMLISLFSHQDSSWPEQSSYWHS